MKQSTRRPGPETVGEARTRIALDLLRGDLSILQSQVNDLIFEVKDVQNVRHQIEDALRECLKAMTDIFLQELRRERDETLTRLRIVEDQD